MYEYCRHISYKSSNCFRNGNEKAKKYPDLPAKVKRKTFEGKPGWPFKRKIAALTQVFF
jgi:hypothetical protein